MYIVLTAMVDLNVWSDVLEGFVQVQSGLSRTNENFARRNDAVYAQLKAFTDQNPAKGGPWLAKATDVRSQASALYAVIDSLKQAIVVNADGPDGDINDIRRMLPHRPAVLLVDRIFYIDDTMVAGIKNVTMNEPFFVGHFPEEPVMPGVLIVEAMAQCSGIMVLSNVPDPENYSP